MRTLLRLGAIRSRRILVAVGDIAADKVHCDVLKDKNGNFELLLQHPIPNQTLLRMEARVGAELEIRTHFVPHTTHRHS